MAPPSSGEKQATSKDGAVRPRMKRDQRHQQLLAMATVVLSNVGIQGLTMERVAEQADVSKPVLYSHFANRNALLLALIEDYWVDTDEATRAHRSGSRSFEERLAAIISGYFDVLAKKGNDLQTLIFRNSHEPVLEQARRTRDRDIEALWASDYERSLGMSHDQAVIAAAIIRSAIAGAGEYFLVHPDAGREACIEACTTIVRSALAGLSGVALEPLTQT
jgi:AcrR family transcriptional regulator